MSDNFGVVFILSQFETHSDYIIETLVSKIFLLLDQNSLQADFVWERRSTSSMQSADLLSKLLVKVSVETLPQKLFSTVARLLGNDFQIRVLNKGWQDIHSHVSDLRCLIVFPICHELTYQWILRLAPLAREQVWLLPNFPNFVSPGLLQSFDFARISGGSYKSILPDIPTTCNYHLWLTPSL